MDHLDLDEEAEKKGELLIIDCPENSLRESKDSKIDNYGEQKLQLPDNCLDLTQKSELT
jgi:hypothetical protein